LDFGFLFFVSLYRVLSSLDIGKKRYVIKLINFVKKIMKILKSLNGQFLLLSAAILLLILGFNTFFPALIHEKIWEIFLFLTVLTLIINLLNSFLLKNFSENFLQIIVLATILRFISSIVFIGLQFWNTSENIILFISNFFLIFLFYLAFDIYSIISNLRQISK
jgi:hypothetical protein